MGVDLTGFGGNLMAHQSEGVEWLLGHPHALLADDVGLGKTVQAAALIAALDNRGSLTRPSVRPGLAAPARVLWITDAMLVEQTRQELARFLPTFTVATIHDRGFGTMKRGQTGPDIAVVNYEGAVANSRRGWLDANLPALTVLDEVSHLRGAGKRFDLLRGVTQRSTRVLSMTATPLQNDPLELFAILRVSGTPGLWPRAEFEELVNWRPAYVDPWGKQRYKPDGWVTGAETTVTAYLGSVMLRRLAKDVQLRLPLRVGDRYRWVPLTPEQEAAYDAAAEQPSALSTHHRQEAAGRVAGASSALVDALLEELAIRGEEQAVVYCETLDVLDLAAERMTAAGVGFVRIEGMTSAAERVRALSSFEGGAVRVLLGSRVLERGLNLQNCRVLLSLDPSWNPAREDQREGRICRIGSPHDTYEHLTILPDTPLTRKKMDRHIHKREIARVIGV